MPEGDTVWNTARALERAVAGRVIERSDFRVPRLASADLAGWTVAESASRGKHLLLRLTRGEEQPLTLHSHLRMDGAWRTFPAGERRARTAQPRGNVDSRRIGGPSHLIRVALHLSGVVAVGYHLHELALAPTVQEHMLVGHLGPDLMGEDWDAREAERRLRQRPERHIADALLDQRNLAGIGNLYKAEVLFLRGVWPWTPVSEVRDLPALVALARRLMNANRGRWTQATTGSLRRGETNWVFERAGAPCRRCGTTIRRWAGGDHDRLTYWCPHCQEGGSIPD